MGDPGDRVCQPTGLMPVAASIAATARAMRSPFRRLVEPIMAFPSPSVRRDFVTAADGIAGQHRQALDRPPGRADGHLCAVAFEKVHDAPPAGAGAVLEMAVDRGIRAADDALLDLIDGLVLGIAVGNRIFRTLLEIDDERHRHPRPARPTRIGQGAAIAQQIAARRSHTTPSFTASVCLCCTIVAPGAKRAT